MIILVCFGSHLPEVMESVKNLAKENELYIPDVPVSGDAIFDLAFAKKNKDKLLSVYNMLADDKSKKVFENTVKFKLSGKPEYLFAMESSREEVFSVLNLDNNESFLDYTIFNYCFWLLTIHFENCTACFIKIVRAFSIFLRFFTAEIL